MIVELGDGQVAGLPDNADVDQFYERLSSRLADIITIRLCPLLFCHRGTRPTLRQCGRRQLIQDGPLSFRLPNWRVPQSLIGQDVALYGEPLFAAVVASPFRGRTSGAILFMACIASLQFRRREVLALTLNDARRLAGKRFIKPADDKCFPAKVYNSGNELPGPAMLDDANRFE